MRTEQLILKIGRAAFALGALTVAVDQALAVEYWLRAAPASVEMPDPNGGQPVNVPMWGYARCGPSFAACDSVTVPGPALAVPPGEALTVHLLNDLPVRTSLVINGLIKPMSPVWDDGSIGARPSLAARVRSFDSEAAPGGQAVYNWPAARPGTYLYQSGTQPQVQVQMGLYGAVTGNEIDAVAANAATGTPAVRGRIYPGAGYEFDNEATLLYSEIDPALHAAVDNGSYGTAAGPTSTFNYQPKYFLVNGRPYPLGAPVITPAGAPGVTLLRLLNAGLTTHVPMIDGAYWDVVAEDGRPYPYRRTQYTALLPAAKTLDVLFTPEAGVTYPIVDRRLSLSNNGVSDGGMLAFVGYGPLIAGGGGGSGTDNAPPVAGNDEYDTVPGAGLTIAAPGVLANDSDTDGPVLRAVGTSGPTAQGGNYTLYANGSFTYVPAAGFTGPNDTFTYVATDGKSVSAPATVSIRVSLPALPALGVLDDFNRATAPSLGAGWSQVATTTASPDLQIDATGSRAIAAATDLGGQAIWNQTVLGAAQGAALTAATPLTNAGLILKASGGTMPESPANYVRVRCESANGGEVVVATMMGGSNSAVFVKQGAFAAPACSGTGTLSATADAKGLVSVWLGGSFVGGVQLPDVAAWKGTGRVGMQLQTVNAAVDEFRGATLP
jgi:hypothetical protein